MNALKTILLLTLTACTGATDMTPGDTMGDMGSETMESKLTLDSSDFLDDGETLWSATEAPLLHGTFEASGPVTIAIQVGAQVPVTATLEGGRWSAQLPDGAITTSSIAVTVTMTGAAKLEVSRLFGFDGAPPAITLLQSLVQDERGDSIDFATGEPVHTHAGPRIDLGSGACPSVYKYAYLMRGRAFGRETFPNPLAWRIHIKDAKLKAGSEAYRVRSDNGSLLLDWTPLPASSVITLDDTNVPFLEIGEGQFFIDVRASDTDDRETTSTICFENHPLEAPLKIEPLQAGALFTTKFADGGAVSTVINGAVLAEQRFTQETAESIPLHWKPEVGPAQYTAMKFGGYIEAATTSYPCPADDASKKCTMWTPDEYAPSKASYAGITAGDYTAELFDVTAGKLLQTGEAIEFAVPPRAEGAPPHEYRLRILTRVAALAPDAPEPGADATVAERDQFGAVYTGTKAIEMGTACKNIVDGVCQSAVTYWNLTALDRGTLKYSSIAAQLFLGNREPGYVSSKALNLGARSWDSGDATLPGGY